MQKGFLAAVMAITALTLGFAAHAAPFDFSFSGPGVSGTVELTYGTATDSRYPGAFVVTGATGTFSDANIGVSNAQITGVVPRNFASPEPANLAAPASFSKFTVAAGLPTVDNNSLSYDDLFWPGGSVQTASDYDAHGGFFDIYGLLFDIGGGRVVNFWSNGDTGGGVNYGVAVATSATALDYVGGGVAVNAAGVAVPEAGSLAMLAAGIVMLGALRRFAA